DALAGRRPDAGDAGLGGLSIEQHGTGRALAFAAAVLRAGEIEIVPEDAQKHAVGICVDPAPRSVDIQFLDICHGPCPWRARAISDLKPWFRINHTPGSTPVGGAGGRGPVA